MLDVIEHRPTARFRHERVFWAVVCGVNAGWLALSGARSVLPLRGVLSWLALVWIFELVVGLTVTLLADWCREDDFALPPQGRDRRPAVAHPAL